MSTSDLAEFLASSFPEFETPPPPRLRSLYADIALRKRLNPDGYKTSLAWWTRVIETVLQSGHQPTSDDVLVFHASDQLLDALRWDKVGRPLGMGAVVQDLATDGALLPVQAFLSSPVPINHQPSMMYQAASYVLTRPLWWILEQVSLIDPNGSTLSSDERWKKFKGNYVVRSLLENAGNTIISRHRSTPHLSLTDALYNTNSFKEEFCDTALPGVTLSEMDIRVVLRHLERDRRVIVCDREVIKFIEDDGDESSQEITVVDRGVLDMKITTRRLEEQIDEIQRQIIERTAKIKDYLRQGSKNMATSYLRSRKQLEELLAKRLGSLETIQTVLLKVENAANDLEVMKAYETSTKTLRTILASPRLQMDHVEKTMEGMSEALADHKEIEDAIKLGGEVARSTARMEELDERELDDELAMLAKEQEDEMRAEAEERRRVQEGEIAAKRAKAEEVRQAREWEALQRRMQSPPSKIPEAQREREDELRIAEEL